MYESYLFESVLTSFDAEGIYVCKFCYQSS